MGVVGSPHHGGGWGKWRLRSRATAPPPLQISARARSAPPARPPRRGGCLVAAAGGEGGAGRQWGGGGGRGKKQERAGDGRRRARPRRQQGIEISNICPIRARSTAARLPIGQISVSGRIQGHAISCPHGAIFRDLQSLILAISGSRAGRSRSFLPIPVRTGILLMAEFCQAG